MPDDHIEIALLKQEIEQDERRISALEKKVAEIDKTVLTGKIGLVVLIGIGTFVGWVVSVSDKVRAWFH